jgi:diacylglycerol kinase family enzyme
LSRPFAIINPAASRCDPERVRWSLQTAFLQEIDLFVLQDVVDLSQLVRERAAAGATAAVAVGLVDTGLPLGIIPVGTGNGLARELGLPTDVEAACRLTAEQPAWRRIDGLRVNGRLSLLRVGVGFEAMAWRALRGNMSRDPKIRYFTARESIGVQIVGGPALPLHSDGEQNGETPFSGEILPGTIEVIVPETVNG